jgi:uncharacterized membrane protein YvbJ
MRCPNCGTENAAGRILCTRCGARLRATAGASAAAPPADPAAGLMERLQADLRRLVVVTALVVAVALLVGNFLR